MYYTKYGMSCAETQKRCRRVGGGLILREGVGEGVDGEGELFVGDDEGGHEVEDGAEGAEEVAGLA